MELRHLRYFLAAAEEENFHRAAERLRVAQPALSRRIRDLEQELGHPLFDRHNKRVRLSAVGRVYLEHIKDVIAALDNANEQTRRTAKGEFGMFRLAFPESVFRSRIVAKSIHQFRSAYPDVEIKLEPMPPSHGMDAVLNGNVDAGFVLDRPAEVKLIEHLPIATHRWILALPDTHELVKRDEIHLRDLANETFIFTRREVWPALYDRLMVACISGGLNPRIVQHTVNESTRLQLVAVGMGVCFVSSSLGPTPTGVVLRPVADFNVPLELDLVWRRDFCPPIVNHYIKIVSALKQASS